MSKSSHWSLIKTLIITLLCGLGHVLSSVILGVIGIIMGIAVARLKVFEAVRDDIAAWALTLFQLNCSLWALWHLNKENNYNKLKIILTFS